jgi:hypothetical protein
LQPSSSARSIAVEMPPAEETWAPKSTAQRYSDVHESPLADRDYDRRR